MNTKLHKAIETELLSHLYRALPTSIIGVSLNALLLTVVMWSVAEPVSLLFWFSAVIVISVYRTWMYWRFKQAGIPADASDKGWRYRFYIPCLGHGLLWGIAGGFFFQVDALQHLLILSFLLAGISAGSIVLLSAHKRLATSYVAIALLPLAARFFWVADINYVFMGTMVLLFLFVNINGIKQIYNNLYENIRLRLEAQENEQIRKRNEDFLNNTGKITKIGGWDFDLVSSTFLWTQQVYDIFEVSADIMPTYEKTLQLFPQHHHSTLRSKFSNLMARAEALTLDVEVALESGQKKWIRVIGNAAAGHDPVTRVYGSFQDITEQKDVEKQLEKASVMAIQATQAKSEFLANMSHEIRTPLHGMLGTLELLKAMPLSPQQLSLAATAEQSAKNMLVIINDVLDISKIESGSLTIENAKIDIRAIIENSCQLFIHNIRKKGLQLQFHYPVTAPRYVFGDALRIQQVLNNLLGNAIKFTEQGIIAIQATCEGDGDECWLTVEVSDTGIGIEDSYLDSLFDAFTQADSSMARKYGGTGLGLTISKRLVALMQGEIGVNSEPNQGSTFWFKLPLRTLKEDDATDIHKYPSNVLLVSRDVFLANTLTDYVGYFSGAITVCTKPTPAQLVAAEHIIIDFDEQDAPVWLNQLPPEKQIIYIDNNTQQDNGIVLHRPVYLHDVERLLTNAQPQSEKRDDIVDDVIGRYQGKVLLVEDNEINQMVSGEMLRQTGLDVEIADNGATAVDMLAQQEFDLVFMDCQMPEMDGFEATKIIRQQEAMLNTPHQVIIALTANVMASDYQQCFTAGMDDFLGKPFTLEQLHVILDEWLNQNKNLAANTVQ